MKTVYIDSELHKLLKHRATANESTITEELDVILKKEFKVEDFSNV